MLEGVRRRTGKMAGTRRGLVRAIGTIAASATLGWSYLSESGDDSVVGTTLADEEPEKVREAPAEGRSPADDRELLDRLRSGGLVLYVPPPEPSEVRGSSLQSSYRECMSPLSYRARRSARQLGDALRALEVPMGAVLSSASCACLDTARLAFGGARRSEALTVDRTEFVGSGDEAFERTLSTPPPYGTNLIRVGRRGPLEAVSDVSLGSGEVAVLGPWGNGVETLGRLRTETLNRRANRAGPPPVSVTTYPIRAGTSEETDVYRRRSGHTGSTVLVVGGIHGNEEAGFRTAQKVTEWRTDAGTLVVVPRANRPAIDRGHRTGKGGRDLNRQFPLDGRPASPLARALWATVTRHDPDLFVDLHTSGGLLARDTGYVGQAVFHSGHSEVASRLETVVADLNREVVPDVRSDYEYLIGRMDGTPEGMVATKAAREWDTPTCIYEVTEADLDLETQVEWTSAFLRRMLTRYGILD